jgi:multidrug efflux pump subunit AcrA (membrane-fusion protein)
MRSAAGKVQATRQVSSADILAAEADLEAALEQQEAAGNIWIRLAQCEPDESGSHSCTATDDDRMRRINQNVEMANTQVALAQARLDELSHPDANNLAVAQASLDSATAQHDAAVARHEAFLLGASAAEIAVAEADLASAHASLEKLLAGPSETDVAIYDIRLDQAETSLREAQNNLDRATLVAAFDGVITAVYASQGEHASGPVVRLLDNNSLEVVLNVDEIDVGRLAMDQPARLSLETWPDVEINSSVMAIAPEASNGASGIVSYDVYLPLQDTGLPILEGMTANANLVIANLKDVLLVPSAALTADRDNGTYTVDVVRRGSEGGVTVTPVEVTVGFRDRQYTQITGGLVEGDEVLLGQLRAPTFTFGFGAGGNGD